MKEPRGLLCFVVALKFGSKERLVGHFPDSGPATSKRILLTALVAEVSEVKNGKLNGGPIGRPKAIQVASLDRALQNGCNIHKVCIDVLLLHVQKFRMLVFVGLLEEAKVRIKSMLHESSRRNIVGVRSRPRCRDEFIRSWPLWGSAVEVHEGILNKPIKRGDDALLVHGERRRVQGKVELNSAVGGAQVSCPDVQPSHQAERTGVAEHIVPPSGCIGLLGDASGLRCELAPSGRGGAKIGPPLVRQQLAECREVVGISVDVADDEGGSHTSQPLIADDGLKDRVSRSCSGGIAM